MFSHGAIFTRDKDCRLFGFKTPCIWSEYVESALHLEQAARLHIFSKLVYVREKRLFEVDARPWTMKIVPNHSFSHADKYPQSLEYKLYQKI